jgi:hypothetical protein
MKEIATLSDKASKENTVSEQWVSAKLPKMGPLKNIRSVVQILNLTGLGSF